MSRALRVAWLAMLVGTAGTRTAPAAIPQPGITLTGCLIGAESGRGYLLTNAAAEPAWQRADPSVTPGPVGTSGSVATIFYWLRGESDLQPHIGHLVEIDGELEGDLEEGTIRIDRKRQWVEVAIRAPAGGLEARLPHSAFTAGAVGGTRDVLVRMVSARTVRVVAACR